MTQNDFKPYVSLDELPLTENGNGGKFEAKIARIGPMLGAKNLGCMLTIVPPGKTAWPYHAHVVEDEMMVILEGEGEYRLGGALYQVKAGDVLAAPPGGEEVAHQLVNTGEVDLKYLAFSAWTGDAAVVVYPDSGKFVTVAGIPEGGTKFDAKFWHLGYQGEGVADYYDGEDEEE